MAIRCTPFVVGPITDRIRSWTRGAYHGAVGNRSFREVHSKPYRIVYRVYDRAVAIMLIADGRRDMRALLARRLLGAWAEAGRT